jgi:chemotaxis protein histidine kinase CheA/ActR/RegA family two-component response regulator
MAEQHDRILGYFLEEASEHLHTIEQGLGKLPETVRQPATIRELFRAAHSIKGSAAMLGLTDVQQVGNQFEANFKLLKEQPQIAVDRHLQSLFLESFSFLRAAIDDVRASSDPYRRNPDTPDPVGDPVFEELKSYLQHLLTQIEQVPKIPEPPARDVFPEPAVEQVFGEYVTRKLGEIAELCLQLDRPEIRSQIQKICQKLGNLGENFEFLEWSNLFAACRLAIANPHNTLPQLGEKIGIAVKQAQIFVLSGRPSAIQIPPDLATLIERQERVAHQPERQSDPFRVDNPHDPYVAMQIDDETTQKLNSSPTGSTEQLPASLAPVLSTITNSLAETNELPAILSQSLTEQMPPIDRAAEIQSTAPAIDFIAADDNFINLTTHSEDADFEANTDELDDFMNSLNGELAEEDTWMTEDDLFDLNDNSPIDFAKLAIDPVELAVADAVESPEPVAPMRLATDPAEIEYDEETFYTPELGDLSDLNDGDIVNFWSETQLAAPQQSLYSALDLPDSIGDRFQPDSSPAFDLALVAPEFTLDAQMSDLFPTVTPPEAEVAEDPAAWVDASDPTIVELSAALAQESDSPAIDTPLESLAFDLDDRIEERSMPSVTTADLEPSGENWDAELTNSKIASDLTSDILLLEDLNSPTLSTTADAAVGNVSAELTNWIDFSLEQNEADLFTTVDLEVLNSNESSSDLELAIAFEDLTVTPRTAETSQLDDSNAVSELDFNPLTDEPIQQTESQVPDVDELDFNAVTNTSIQPEDSNVDDFSELELQPIASDFLDRGDLSASDVGELDFNAASDELAELALSLDRNIEELDFNFTASEPLDLVESIDLHNGALDLHHSNGNSVEQESSLDGDLQALALNFSDNEDLSPSIVGGAELSESNDFGGLDFSFLDEDNADVDGSDEPASALDSANELFDDWNLNDLTDRTEEIASASDLSAEIPQSLSSNLELASALPEISSSDRDFADLDLHLLDNPAGSSEQIPSTEDAFNLDLLALDLSTDLDRVGGGEAAIAASMQEDGLSSFEDLSELDFNLDMSSSDLADGELPDLAGMLAAAPADELTDASSLDALLGGAAILGVGSVALTESGAFDGLDDLLGDSAPTANSAAPLEDLDRLLAVPALIGVEPPAVAAQKKVPDRRSKQRTFEQTMRVSVRHLDNLNNLVGELVVNRNTLEQDQNRMRQFVEKLLSEVQKLNEVGKRMQDLYERSLMENSLVASRQQYKPTATPNSVPANLQDLEQTGTLMEYDPLEMDRFTPIHLLSQKMIELTVRIRESTADIEFVVDGSTEVTRTLRQITGQLQEDLTKSRMVPFAQTADRLQRGVRENGLRYGKHVELSVEGRDTLIDKVILESLTDPLIHMVNNGIAHGIESAQTRQADGKPPEGKIMIRALHQGNQTIISISDDGAGIDTERVKAKAIEKGIITARQAATMSKTETYELLFLPSFSTKDAADELAGRGVGMDVVRTSLTEIRGTITTESQLGIGTTFTIRLPLALSIAKALIAVNNKTNIAFPMDGIEDTQDVSPEQIQTNQAGEQCIFWRDELMPFKPLSDLLGFNRPLSRNNFYGTQEDDSDLISILILRSDGNLIAVQVDKIVGDQEIVIKPLQGPAPKPLGIAGATVLGDGRIVPIADVMELIELANGTLTRHVSTQWANQINTPTVELRESMVLIVDDSITVRELLSLTFKRAGYRVEQARDGQEAWDKLRAGLPCDIVFCDIEMPRMDGLEFLSRIQKDAALKKVPVAMLTSRGSDRHRQIASQLGASGYFIKPYLEEALLDAAKRMIQGEVLAIV